ncbi:hypothetical protein KIPB_015585, partial [Kipferlia bialata]|eukprot:g15585.t1
MGERLCASQSLVDSLKDQLKRVLV